MSSFEKAEVDKSNGTILLEKDTNYFFDANEKSVFPTTDFGGVTSELLVNIPNSYIMNVLSSGRGHVLVSLRADKNLVVPNKVARKTGYFYVLPQDMGLQDVQRELYGETYGEPRGFFEFLGSYNPALLQHMINAAETVEETAAEVTDNTSELVKLVIGGVASTIILYIIAQAIKRK